MTPPDGKGQPSFASAKAGDVVTYQGKQYRIEASPAASSAAAPAAPSAPAQGLPWFSLPQSPQGERSAQFVSNALGDLFGTKGAPQQGAEGALSGFIQALLGSAAQQGGDIAYAARQPGGAYHLPTEMLGSMVSSALSAANRIPTLWTGSANQSAQEATNLAALILGAKEAFDTGEGLRANTYTRAIDTGRTIQGHLSDGMARLGAAVNDAYSAPYAESNVLHMADPSIGVDVMDALDQAEKYSHSQGAKNTPVLTGAIDKVFNNFGPKFSSANTVDLETAHGIRQMLDQEFAKGPEGVDKKGMSDFRSGIDAAMDRHAANDLSAHGAEEWKRADPLYKQQREALQALRPALAATDPTDLSKSLKMKRGGTGRVAAERLANGGYMDVTADRLGRMVDQMDARVKRSYGGPAERLPGGGYGKGFSEPTNLLARVSGVADTPTKMVESFMRTVADRAPVLGKIKGVETTGEPMGAPPEDQIQPSTMKRSPVLRPAAKAALLLGTRRPQSGQPQ